MKKLTSLAFLLCMAFGYAQIPSFTVQYFDAKPWQQTEIASIFDNFYEGVTFKSGGLYLERLGSGNTEGTHRIVFFGDSENWGMEEDQKTSDQRRAFWREFTDNVESMGPRYTGRIIDYQGEGSPDSYGYVQIYELKVADPESFLKAHKKLVSQLSKTMEGRPVAFGTYDIGLPGGASHWVAVAYKGVGDNLKMKVATEKFSKEWKAYYEARGEVEQTGNFDLRILKTYGSFD